MDALTPSNRLVAFARRYAVGVALILVFGIVRLPFERGLARERVANSVNPVPLDLSLRERVSQKRIHRGDGWISFARGRPALDRGDDRLGTGRIWQNEREIRDGDNARSA